MRRQEWAVKEENGCEEIKESTVAQQLEGAQKRRLRRRVQEVEAQHVGHAERLELQHRCRQVAALDLRHRL